MKRTTCVWTVLGLLLAMASCGEKPTVVTEPETAADITRLCKQYGAAAFYWMGIVDKADRQETAFKWSMEQVADSIVANKK